MANIGRDVHENEDITKLSKRLDAIIRLISEYLLITNKENFNIGVIVRTLHSAGLTPTEVSEVLGKKSVTDIAPFLYAKKKRVK